MNENSVAKIPVLKAFIVITQWKRQKKLLDLFHSEHVHLLYEFMAEGTASSDILDLLGLDLSEKIVAVCFAPDEKIEAIKDRIKEDLRLEGAGRGIAFEITISGLSRPSFNLISGEITEKIKTMEENGENAMKDNSHELILSVINRGYSDELMHAAKTAGAVGGTVINARHAGIEETIKFYGISVQEEKEIVLIVTQKENKTAIMKEISKNCGLNTKAQGIVFSLPVDEVMGVN